MKDAIIKAFVMYCECNQYEICWDEFVRYCLYEHYMTVTQIEDKYKIYLSSMDMP